MNLIFSYSMNDDQEFAKKGHRFIGAGVDENGKEVHIFLRKDEVIATGSGKDESFDWFKEGFWAVKTPEGKLLMDTLADNPYSSRAQFLRTSSFRWSAAEEKGYKMAELLETKAC